MKKSTALTFILTLLVASACHFEDPKNRAKASKDLVIATVHPIGEVTPFSRAGIGAGLVDLLYGHLFRLSSEGKLMPELGKSFQWNGDHSELRVTLREARALDVQNSFEQVARLKLGDFSEGFVNLEKIEIPSPFELIFRLKKFDRGFLNVLVELPIVTRRAGDFTGDFFIASQAPNEIVLRRKIPSPRLVNAITVRQIPSLKRAMRELVAQNADMLLFPGEGESKVLTDLEEIVVGELRYRRIYLVLENRKRLRLGPLTWQALDRKLDRHQLISQLNEPGLIAADDPIPKQDPWLKGHPERVAPEYPPPAADLRPFKSKTPLVLSFLGGQAMESKVARLLKRHFSELGYRLTLKEYPFGDFIKEVYEKRNYDLVLIPYVIRDTLMSVYLDFHTPAGSRNFNISNFSSPAVDSLFDEARYSVDEEKAKGAFLKAVHALMEDPPGLFLFWFKSPIMYRRSCSGFSFNGSEFFSSLKDVRCEPSAAN